MNWEGISIVETRNEKRVKRVIDIHCIANRYDIDTGEREEKQRLMHLLAGNVKYATDNALTAAGQQNEDSEFPPLSSCEFNANVPLRVLCVSFSPF